MNSSKRPVFGRASVKLLLSALCAWGAIAAGPAGALNWGQSFGAAAEMFDSSPFYADLDGDGDTEVVVASGTSIYAYDGATGAQLSFSPISLGAVTGGAVGMFEPDEYLTGRKQLLDLDGDGTKELLAIMMDGSGNMYMKAYNPATGVFKWNGPGGMAGETTMTGLIANIDGDSAYEMIFSSGAEIGSTGVYQNRALNWYDFGGTHDVLEKVVPLGTGPELKAYALEGGTLAVICGGTVTFYSGITGAELGSVSAGAEFGDAAFLQPRRISDASSAFLADIDGGGGLEFGVKFSSCVPDGSSYTYRTVVYLYDAATLAWRWNTSTMTATSSYELEEANSELPIRAYVAPFLGSGQYGLVISSATWTGPQDYDGNTTLSMIDAQTKNEAWRTIYQYLDTIDVVDVDAGGTAEVALYKESKVHFLNGLTGAELWNIDPAAGDYTQSLYTQDLANLVRASADRWIPVNMDNAGNREVAVLVASGSSVYNRDYFVFQYDAVTHEARGRTWYGVVGSSDVLEDEIEVTPIDTNGDSKYEFALYLRLDKDSSSYQPADQRVRVTESFIPQSFACQALSTSTIKWNWENFTGETGYSVADGTRTVLHSVAADALEWDEGGLGSAPSYTRFARVLTGFGYGESTSLTCMTYPVAPTDFAGVPQSSTSINWQWTDIANNESAYRVYSSTGILLSGVLSSGTQAWPESGLSPNALYTRYANVYNSFGSSNSVADSTYTLAAVPAGLTLTALSSTSLRADWGPNGNPLAYSDYQVAVSSDAGFNLAFTTFTLVENTTTYTATGLTGAVVYYVGVRGKHEGFAGYTSGYAYASKFLPGPPSQPGGFGPAAVATNTITWGWTASTFTDEYRLYTDTGGYIAAIDSTTLTYQETGLTAATLYTRYVRAWNEAYYTNSDSSASYTLAAVPADHAQPLVYVASSSLRVQWEANGNPGGTSYNAWLSTAADFGAVSSATVAQTYADFSGLAGNTTYYAKTRALNGAGLFTGYNNAASTTTAPQPPSAASYVAVETTSITAGWTPGTNNLWGLSYRVELATDSAFSPLTASSVTVAGAAQFGVSGTALTPNSVYYVRVRAETPAIAAGYVTLPSTYTLAAVPGTPSLTPATRTRFNAAWEAGGNPAGTNFSVEYSTDSGFAAAVSTASVLTSTSTQFTSLVPGSTYYTRVKAVNALGVSSVYSSTASATAWRLPVILTVTPSSGTTTSTGTAVAAAGSCFRTGDTAYLLKNGATEQATVTTINDAGSFSANFVLVGLSTGAWELILKDAEGNSPAVTAAFTIYPLEGVTLSSVAVSGSTIASSDNGFTVGIPAGVLNGGFVYISTDPLHSPVQEDSARITQANGALPPGRAMVPGGTVEVVAYDSAGQQVTTPASAVTITIYYDDANGDGVLDGTVIRAANLYLVWLNPATSAWETVTGYTLDAPNRRVYAPVTHFSVFALAGVVTMPDLSTAKVYPNPWKPGSGGSHDRASIKFDKLADNTSIRIYNITGELVRELPGNSLGYAEWDGKADGGKKAASGVYFARLKCGAGSKTLKFAIER